MTGWRLGYATASEKLAPLLEKMLMIQQYTFVCAPTPFQMSILSALDCEIGSYVDNYRKKRDRMLEGLGECFDVIKPGGAFYMFVKVPEQYPNATEFVKKAIENNVLIIPGNVFSQKDTHFRLSYVATEEKLEQGIDVLCKLAKNN
jgi:aspartate aminotransferase/aminotransferase